jgi:sporadic carbohydrate cluster 2OG-Fe(II) oxygenase
MFFTSEESKLTSEYLTQGYVVRPIKHLTSLDWLRANFMRFSSDFLAAHAKCDPGKWLDHIHCHVSAYNLNEFRLEMIKKINAESELRLRYFELAQPWLEILAGNELAMQTRLNLSIQLPGDNSSLLPIHADTWSGDSPFEVVVWIPLVDCYGTKSMYILPSEKEKRLRQQLFERGATDSNDLYESIASDVRWLEVPYGHVLLFNQCLPHGNRTNQEPDTRWSMNCRFKGIFTPYRDKQIGEFFEPITLRAVSRIGIDYQDPHLV